MIDAIRSPPTPRLVSDVTQLVPSYSVWQAPAIFPKSQSDLLLEAAVLRFSRPEAVKALVWLGSISARSASIRHDVILKCSEAFAPGTLMHYEPDPTQQLDYPGEAILVPIAEIKSFRQPAPHEKEWQRTLALSQSLHGPQQTPPSSDFAVPDRNPMDGITDLPTVAVWNDNSGLAELAFSRQGFNVLWARSPSNPCNPYSLASPDVLIAFPDSSPFHPSAPGLQHDAVADTCTALLVMSVHKPLLAVFEFPAAMWTMQHGTVKAFFLACAEVLQYRCTITSYDRASFSAFSKDVICISATRRDMADSWGLLTIPPPPVNPQTWPLLLPRDLPSHLIIDQTKVVFKWIVDPSSVVIDDSNTKPIQVAWAHSNTCGNRVYMAQSPAVKSSTFGVGGNSHLIAQKDAQGKWQVRKLQVSEIVAQISTSAATPSLPNSPLKALAALASTPPHQSLSNIASCVLAFMRPPLSKIPSSIDDIISPDDTHIFRANMKRMHKDFSQMVKSG